MDFVGRKPEKERKLYIFRYTNKGAEMTQDKPAALVTGAATGIGRAAAVALANAGFEVIINYSRSEQAARWVLSFTSRRIVLRSVRHWHRHAGKAPTTALH